MAANYIVEVTLMARGTWTSRGFHEKGSGHPDDPLTVSGWQRALKMSEDFARRRCEFYRSRGHHSRILDSDGRVVLDWAAPLVEPQKYDRETLHRSWKYRGLDFIENRQSGLFFHKFRWPVESGPERSIFGLSCEEVVARMQAMGDDIPQYLQTHLDRIEPAAEAPVTPEQPVQPSVKFEPGFEIVSFRPGSVRS